MPADRVESILVFRIGSLGDTVVSLPALREVRRRHPGARIVLLTNTPVDGGLKAASAIQVLSGTGLVDDAIEYPHGALSPGRLLHVCRQIRSRHPRTCYFLMPDRSPRQAWRDKVFFRLAGIRTIVGLDPGRLGSRPPEDGSSLWESESKRLLRAIGSTRPGPVQEDFSLVLTGEEERAAARALEQGNVHGQFIVFCIGTKHAANEWGDERWGQCLRELGAAVPQYALVSIGSASESPRSTKLLAGWPGATLNLCGSLTPRQSAALIARSSLFLGHDSGPMHLASAVAAPIIAIFSARNLPGIWFPFANTSHVFYNAVPCRGCGLEVCLENKQVCMTSLAPSAVAARAIELLSIPNRVAGPRVLTTG
jgi:ADP-heptose:LPS heptosyltransferase